MTYKEDMQIPGEYPINTEVDREFEEWYENHFHNESSPRSARYYQMRESWRASKNYYQEAAEAKKEGDKE